MSSRSARIESLLRESLQPVELVVTDDSAAHAGHAGAAGGAGHYSVRVVSDRFAGLTVRERHRLVYQALASLMPAEIHALSIVAQAPESAPVS